MSLGCRGGGLGLEANLKMFSEEKRELCRAVAGAAIAVVDAELERKTTEDGLLCALSAVCYLELLVFSCSGAHIDGRLLQLLSK